VKTAPAIAVLVAMGLIAGCATHRSPPRLDWIQVAPGQPGFVEARRGQPFTPWGFNYDRDFQMRLIEDFWETEWSTVVEDFREMKALGANVVRVHLQLARFMTAPDQPNNRALGRLRQLLALAEATGLYLDLTGLGCYRKADVPAWLSALAEAERWRVQARFWEAIARTCADSPAVFCYNLINEPFVPGQPRPPGDWLAGELAGFHYVQALVLDPAGRAPPEIARQWTEQMVAAIRRHDARHLITLGFLPNSSAPFIHAVAPALDFVCVHLYPQTGKLAAARETLRRFQVGKPVVVEETFPLHCRSEELVAFIQEESATVAGWLSFYWGQTPEELAAESTMSAAIIGGWLEQFGQTKPPP
jgi:hypothetical protein